jgi:hypothetical protein
MSTRTKTLSTRIRIIRIFITGIDVKVPYDKLGREAAGSRHIVNTTEKDQRASVKGIVIMALVIMLAFGNVVYSRMYSDNVTNTQEAIVGSFKNNIDTFATVAAYISGSSEKEQLDKQTNFYKVNSQIRFQCKKILQNLSYMSITEDADAVYFLKTDGTETVSAALDSAKTASEQKGILYLKNPDTDMSGRGTLIQITDRWYYYEIGNN